MLTCFQSHWRRSGCTLHLYRGDFGAQRPGGGLGYLQSTRAGGERTARGRSSSNSPAISFGSCHMAWVQVASSRARRGVWCVHSQQPACLRGSIGVDSTEESPGRPEQLSVVTVRQEFFQISGLSENASPHDAQWLWHGRVFAAGPLSRTCTRTSPQPPSSCFRDNETQKSIQPPPEHGSWSNSLPGHYSQPLGAVGRDLYQVTPGTLPGLGQPQLNYISY